MSYRCDKCNKERVGSELKHIAEVRDVTYVRSFLRFDRKERKQVAKYDTSFKGVEIVTEERLCDECHEIFKDSSPKISNTPKTVNFVGEQSQTKTTDKPEKKPDFKGLKDKFEKRR